jgi:hypothetical protein
VASSVVQVPPHDMPLYWFAKLERAVEEGNHQDAADAQRQLDRLGVHVAFGRPKPPRQGATRHAG